MIHPNWKAYSEIWLHRMIKYLSGNIAGMACFSPDKKIWNKNIPVFDLYGPKNNIVRRIIYRAGFAIYFLNTDVQKHFNDFLKRVKPTVIFINFIGPALYLKKALSDLEIPVIIHVHGADIFPDMMDMTTLKPIHSSAYKKEVLELYQSIHNIHFIANSFFSRKKLKDFGIPENKISIKYFGVKCENAKTNFNKDLKILFLGRFVDFKGPDIVVEAFIMACERGFSGALTMVGDGPLRSMCMLMAFKSDYADRIIFKDPVDEEEALMHFKEADIYTMHNCKGIISGQEETFGVTIIEAMAQGTPVITGNSGGPAEILTDGYNGFLIEPYNVNDHVNKFLFFQNNPQLLPIMSKNCIKTIEQKFLSEKERECLLGILAD